MKTVGILILFGLTFLLSYWVMTTGWGLTVASWPVIIAGWLLSALITILTTVISD